MNKYFFVTLCAISLLAAACGLGEKSTAGVIKTGNGGVDWQSSNKIKNNDKGEISGLSITKLEYDPLDDSIVYASASNAGLYKSEDGGGSWENILSTIPVWDFAIDPIDPKIIYVAGSFDKQARALATRDGGKSWNEVFNEGISGSSVRSVAVNPANPQQVVLGMSHGGIVLSNDSGLTWRLVQSYQDRISKILWRNEAIYILVKNSGVYKSTDGGVTFQHLTTNLRPANTTSGSFGFVSSVSNYSQIAVSQENPNIIFITTNAGLYRSDNGGASWGFVSMPLRQKQLSPTTVAISPISSSVVYVGVGSTIYKTTDGGGTWLTADTKTNNTVSSLLVSRDLSQVALAGLSVKASTF